MNIITLENRIKIDDFLQMESFYKNKNITDCSNRLIIYKITNKINNKIYIGKTKNIQRRASEYINEYSNKHGKKRLIWLAMQKYGIDNFIMEPIDIADNKVDLSIKELYYIELLHACDPNVGYNTSIQSVITPDHVMNYNARKQYADEKMRRSKLLAAVNPVTKEIIYSTGLKLFGDYINRSKDEVKSAAKRSSTLEGYFLFYLNQIDFNKQIEYVKKFSSKDRHKVDYDTFFKLAKLLINKLIYNSNDENYSLKFIHQFDNIDGHMFSNPKIFEENYQKLIRDKKIIPIESVKIG